MLAAATTTTDASPLTTWLPPLLMVAGVVVLGVIFVMSVRSRIAARKAERPEPRAVIEQIKSRRATHDDFDARAAELLSMSTDLAARLDARAARLEQLLREADERMQRLGMALANAEIAPAADAVREEPTPLAEPATSEAARRRDERSGPSVPSIDPLTRSVYDLADEGRAPVQIARELNEHVGKVELILALRDPTRAE